jgi:lysophospholipase L1-like esterase
MGARARRGLLLTLLLPALMLSACSQAPAPAKPITGIGSIAVLGDSISVATATCGYTTANCNENSWATGTNPDVNSLAERLDHEQGTSVIYYTAASAGAKVADLGAQVDSITNSSASYVAILVGSNDYCAPSLGQMTSPTAYEASLNAVMQRLTQTLPQAYVSIASVPNPQYLYAANRGSAQAQKVWQLAGICQSMLANPTDDSADAKARRQAVVDRAAAYNTAIAEVCAQYPRCHYDGGAVFDKKFDASLVGDLDYFHPSIRGQAELANLEWTTGGVRDWLREQTNANIS